MSTEPAAVIVRGVVVAMGGRGFIVPALPLGALEDLEGALDIIGEFKGGRLPKEYRAALVEIAQAALARNYPGITPEEVAGLLDLDNFGQVVEAILGVSGMERTDKLPGEAPAQDATG